MGGRRVKKVTEEKLKPEPKPEEKKEKPAEKPVQKAKKPREKKVRGKEYLAARAKVEPQPYPPEEAVRLVKELSLASFDASVDLHLNLEIPKEQSLRLTVALPHGTGKELRVLILAKKEDEARIEEIAKSGKVEADVVVATPALMPALAKIARILGPKGLMPTPKSGTVTEEPEKVAEELKKGRVEIKTEAQPATASGGAPQKAGVVHLSIGKVSFPDEHLLANLKVVAGAVAGGGAKIHSAYLAPTMGPSVKLDLAKL